jgi:hypothetical protein
MPSLTKRDIIRIIISQHQSVIHSGGITYRSSKYCTLIRRQRLLLLKFQLPATNENLIATVDYPLCPPTSSILASALCNTPEGYVHFTELSMGISVSKGIIRLGKGELLESQVEYVYDSLIKLVKQYKNH